MSNFETLIEQCNADLRDGNPHLVSMRLSQYKPSRIPRPWRLPLAKICRRAGLYGLGLRLLTRLVENDHAESATPAETTEYSALLFRSGAVGEALEILQKVDAAAVPEKYLIQAFAHFGRWEYELAIFELESYLNSNAPADTMLMGRSNLAFALVECRRHDQALRLIRENIARAKEQNHFHLESYNHALCGQLYLQEEEYAKSRAAVDLALRQCATAHQSFAMKLRLILDGLESKRLEPFAELRQLAAAKRDWYALRDADLFSLKVQFEPSRFLHLYFGSPLAKFRERIREELNHVSNRHTYVLGPKPAPRFDLLKGEIDGRRLEGAGFKSHQLIEILLRDFYEPLRIGSLHAALFPGEHFNIFSSPDRVHQVIRRTRRWLSANSIPARIHEAGGFYSLEITGHISFRIPLERKPIVLLDLQLEDLKKIFASQNALSSKAIQLELNMSTAAVQRLLRHAIHLGMIERIGSVKRTQGYRLMRSRDPNSKAA